MAIRKGNDKKTNLDKLKANILSKLSSLGGVITILFACVATGFTVGRYYEEIKLNDKLRELENKHQLQIIELKEGQIREVVDLKNENHLFKIKNNYYEEEIRKNRGQKIIE